MVSRLESEKKRKKALRRRLPILVKKTEQFATLCGVPACLVVYSPGEAEPVVWPSPEAAADVVQKYRDQPDVRNFKNELDCKEFLQQKNDKVRAQISRVQQQRREAEIKLAITEAVAGRRVSFDDLPNDILASVGCRVQSKLEAIRAQLQEIRSGAAPPPPSPAPAEDVQMVAPLTMAIVATPLLQAPMMLETPPPPQHDGPTPMAMDMDAEPRHDSTLLEMFDPFNVAGNGSTLPTTQDMGAVLLHAGIFSSPLLPNPSFNPY
jgi:hypothetical protein